MAAVVGALRAELSASIAQFKDDMGKAAQAVRAFASDAEKQARKLEAAGKQLSISLTAPLLAFGYAAVKQGTEATKAMAQVEAALKSTGGASGKTADQLSASADALENISLFDKADILGKVTASLLSFSNVSGPVFDRAQKDVVDLAARFGTDLEPAAIQVGRALQNPAKGMDALRRAGILFSADQKKVVTQLQATGQGAKAQAIILEQIEKQVAGAAAAQRAADPFGALKQSINNLEEAWGPLITDFLKPTIKLLTDLANAIKELPGPFKTLAIGVGLFLAAIGPVLYIGGSLIKSFGTLATIAASLAGAITALGTAIAAAIGISLAALVGWAVALAAAVGAVVIFWKSINDVIHGNFAQAWQDAKASAQKLVDSVNGIFKKNPAELPVSVQGPKTGDRPNGGFDVPQQVAQATKQFEESLRGMDDKISSAFGHLELPKSVAAANDLNAQINEFIKRAQEAGVGTGAFSGKLKEMRDRIEELKKIGLAKEAKEFGQAVNDDTKAVDQFSRGGLDPLTEKLNAVDDQYKSLKDKITDQITQNTLLADANDDAGKSMDKLKSDLSALEDAHKKATLAATNQYQAEQGLAHLQSEANKNDLRNQIQDITQAKGQSAPIGSDAQAMQEAGRQLNSELIAAETKYQELANQRLEGENTLSDQQKTDLDDEIKLAKKYADVVGETTAQEIVDARRVSDAFSQFADDLSSQLSDMIATWTFDLKGLQNVFADLAKKLFIQPFLQSVTSDLSGALNKIGGGLFGGGGFDVSSNASGSGEFAGLFAAGGFVPPGQWGIAGEKGPEPVYGGNSGMTVMPRGAGGVTVVQNIQTPDYGAFRMSQRQLVRRTKLAFS